MPGKSVQLGLTRRVVVLYLLFCLTAVVWLTAGVVYVSQSIGLARADTTCLTRLGKASSLAEIAYLRNGADSFQPLVERLQSEGQLAYCAVVSEGRYLAHSDRTQIGRPAVAHAGEILRWGDVQGVRFARDKRVVREYQTGLTNQGDSLGALMLAVNEPSLWGTCSSVARYVPLSIAAPLFFISIGAVLLQRMVRPVAGIEQQLSQLATQESAEHFRASEVAVTNAASLGWNRLVDRLNDQGSRPSLNERLAAIILARQQGHVSEILNSLPDGIAVTNEQGEISFANEALAGLLGLDDAPSLQGTDIFQYFSTDSEPEPRNAMQGGVRELERNQAGTTRVLRVARHALQDTQGHVKPGHIWSIRDVTQQKITDRMRDQFLDSATHELRTPLTNIRAYAETLGVSEVMDVEQQKEFCNIINQEATRLGRFIDDLLSVSSMEMGSLTVSRQPVQLERLLTEVLDKVGPLMHQRKIDFHKVFPAKLPEARLDKDKVVAVLVNLLGNAAKYTSPGGRVELRVQAVDDRLNVEVQDTGFGISAEELPHVFDKFFRSKDRRVRNETGTGLGLSLAQEIVRLHHGEITVESQPGRGSTFQVVLPIK